jgi:selenocysteine lyase/cysteine desulfurase
VDERVVDREAAARGISLRTGCFCNPGAAELAFGIQSEKLQKSSAGFSTFDDYVAAVGLKSGGAVRISVGPVTTFSDVFRFMRFASGFRDRTARDIRLAPRAHC